MLINKKKLQSILKRDNIFDEKFFMYLENDDLCKRVRDKNEKIFIIPSSKIRHYGAKGYQKFFIKKSNYLETGIGLGQNFISQKNTKDIYMQYQRDYLN